ncbi:MAG: ATP-binding protein [Erythrobacter sp.]|nr:ATP-binding protein [Erythrobacter sp.]
MRRLLPSSLLGQVTLVLAIGLLVAQAVSAFALYRAQEQRRDVTLVNSIAFRLIAGSAGFDPPEMDRFRSERREARRRAREGELPKMEAADGERRRPTAFTRLLRLSLQRSDRSPVARAERRLTRYETELRRLLEEQEVSVGEIRITRRIAGEDPHVRSIMRDVSMPRFKGWRERGLIVAAIEQAGSEDWLTVRLPEPRQRGGGFGLILLQTAVIFIVLLALLYLVLRRLTRPLAALTDRLSDFSRQPDQPLTLPESGPADMRRLIAAHNAMEARIAALLDEKNVMLGAIGHDLKTPLAALRVRIESHPDERQRAALAAGIEDIACTLDDILALARAGANAERREAVDLTALAQGVVEEFEDLGHEVSMVGPEAGAARIAASIQETWIKRALRNLVSNAVRYGGGASVGVWLEEGGRTAVLAVLDDGPGIAEDRMAEMLEPFTRGEASRNRATGGTGLGLTLARAIAQAHGGELRIANRPQGGLSAEIRLPI